VGSVSREQADVLRFSIVSSRIASESDIVANGNKLLSAVHWECDSTRGFVSLSTVAKRVWMSLFIIYEKKVCPVKRNCGGKLIF